MYWVAWCCPNLWFFCFIWLLSIVLLHFSAASLIFFVFLVFAWSCTSGASCPGCPDLCFFCFFDYFQGFGYVFVDLLWFFCFFFVPRGCPLVDLVVCVHVCVYACVWVCICILSMCFHYGILYMHLAQDGLPCAMV